MGLRTLFFVLLAIALAAPNGGAVATADAPERDGVFYGWWHDAGELLLHVSNFGFYGSFGSDASAPSAEWPAASGVEHLYVAGPWFGAISGGDTLVTTSAFTMEFRPPPNDSTYVIYTGSLDAAGGLRFVDDDGDGSVDEDPLNGFDDDLDGVIDEDYGGISDQMFVREYADTLVQEPQPPTDPHVPLGLAVREESYVWSADDRDDFVGVHYEFTNISSLEFEDIYIGILVDPDVGDPDVEYNWTDDIAFFSDGLATPGLDGYYDPVRVMAVYGHDAPGGADGDCESYFGAVLLDHPVDPGGVNAPVEVAPHGYRFWSGGGEPETDGSRHAFMAGAGTPEDPTPPSDVRALLVAGPFASLAPGETLSLDIAFVCGNGLDGFLENAATAVTVRDGYYSKQLGQQVHWRLRDEVTPLWNEAFPGPYRTAQPTDRDPGKPALLPTPSTDGASRVELSMPEAAPVFVAVYDVAGRAIATLADGEMAAGIHSVEWDGRTDGGAAVSSGIYFVRATVGGNRLSAKVALIR